MSNNLVLKFDSLFLAQLSSSLLKRRKAIKNKTTKTEFQKVIEKEANNPDTEKLEITMAFSEKVQIRLFAWDDRWVWVDVRQSSKNGWLFEWTLSGRVLQDSVKNIVSALEESILHAANSDGNALSHVWNKILYNGPSATI